MVVSRIPCSEIESAITFAEIVIFIVLSCEQHRVAPDRVLPVGDWFGVPGVDAAPGPALVVQDQAGGDWPSQAFIGCAMSNGLFAVDIDAAIAVAIETAYPEPARCAKLRMRLSSDLHPGPETVRQHEDQVFIIGSQRHPTYTFYLAAGCIAERPQENPAASKFAFRPLRYFNSPVVVSADLN